MPTAQPKRVLSFQEMRRLAHKTYKGPHELYLVMRQIVTNISLPSVYRFWRGLDMRDSTLDRYRRFFDKEG